VIFTVEEANHLLEELRPRIERLIKLKREFNTLQTETEVLSCVRRRVARQPPNAQELKRQQQRRTLLLEQIAQGAAASSAAAVLVKDLDKGLVDFYAPRATGWCSCAGRSASPR